jgi:DNA-binding transcriptional LysR family regulator
MDLDSLDLRKLRAFYLVARHGSLQRAATRLNVTVSAVSFSIHRLEEQLGIPLFRRLPNRLILTPAGVHFADSAEAIFDGINKILADSAIDVQPSGRLYISVTSDLAWYFIPKVRDFLKLYPDIELGVYIKTSSESLRLVERREIDL